MHWSAILSPQNQQLKVIAPAAPPNLSAAVYQAHDVSYVKTPNGSTLLVMDGYTYSKNGGIRKGGTRYACSKLLKNCKAFAHVSQEGEILKAETVHNHEPPQYTVTSDGILVKTKKI